MVDNFYVYEHWRLDRDECFYVGKGKVSRAYSRKVRNRHWWHVVNKLERLGYAYEVRFVKTGLSQEEAFALEIERISFWNKSNVELANILPGGLGGPTFLGKTHSTETKAKMAKKAKGNKGRKGQKLTEAHKAKLSEKLIGNTRSKGKPKPEGFGASVSARLKGVPKTEAHKEKLRAAWARRKERADATAR